MKRMILVMMMAVLVLTGGITLGLLTKSNGEVSSEVKSVGVVRETEGVVINTTNSNTVIRDNTGNEWIVRDDRLAEDDVVIMWLNDMNTKSFEDDEVINYRLIITE